jgi:hypothetical protein
MNLSQRELSIWGSLATTLVVYGYYFAEVFTAQDHRNSMAQVWSG